MAYVRGITERGIDYDEVRGLLTLGPNARADAESFLNRNFERVAEGWRQKPQTVPAKAKSFVTSVLSGKASPEVLAQRRLSCFGDENTPACSELTVNARGSFCKKCRCPMWGPARLDGDKLTFAYLECPLKRPGFSNEAAP